MRNPDGWPRACRSWSRRWSSLPPGRSCFTIPSGVIQLSEGHRLADRLDEAADGARHALELARAHEERGHQVYALRLLGEIAAHREPAEIESAEIHFRQAKALAEELGMRPLVAHCQLGLGQLSRRMGKREQAREHLTTATTMYREMDMRFGLEQADSEIRALA